jgi:hypothetical protein
MRIMDSRLRIIPALALLAAASYAVRAQDATAGEPPRHPALPLMEKPSMILGAIYGRPVGAAKAGAEEIGPLMGEAEIPAATATPPGADLLTQYRIPFPGMSGPFLRPAGTSEISLFFIDIDWHAPEAKSLLAREVDGALEKFLRVAAATVKQGGASVRVMIPPPPADAAGAVFIKRLSSALRGERRDVKFGLLLPGDRASEILNALNALELAPYIDGWWLSAADATPARAAGLNELQLKLDLTAELGITGLPVKAQLSAAPLAAGLNHGFRLFVFDPQPRNAKYLPTLRKMIPIGAVGVNLQGKGGALRVNPELEGKLDPLKGIPGNAFVSVKLELAKLYDEASNTEFLFFFAPDVPEKNILLLILPTADVSNPQLLVPLHDVSFPLETSVDERNDNASANAYARGEPFLISYKRQARVKPEPIPVEGATVEGRNVKLSVKAQYQIPIEELIKRYQAFQAGQDFRLDRYTAKADVHYLWGIGATNATLNVTFKNNFFFDRKAGATWEQTAMLVEGLPWRGGAIPELPIPQPEKVNAAPLDIDFGKQYSYELVGEEAVNGRPAYKVRFHPLDPAAPLYDGILWIDAQSYARLRVSAVQTNLKQPMLSNDETTDYAPVRLPDGGEVWVMAHIHGQQTFSAMGLLLKAVRTVEFSSTALNPADYSAQLAAAEAGNHRMLKDTDLGLKYYEKNKAGVRVVRDARTKRLMLGAAIFSDPSIDVGGSPVAMAAVVDYFDTNFMKKDWQFNAAISLVYNSLVLANPHLFDGKTTGTAVANISLLKFSDRFYELGQEQLLERVNFRDQQLIVAASHPLGNYFNLRGGVSFQGRQFFAIRPKEKGGVFRGTGAGFDTPDNHVVVNFGGVLDFSRRGWGAALGAETNHRTRWSAWGTPAQQLAFDPATRDFSRWDFALSKEFSLPKFQRISALLVWMDGRHLDRFSQYTFSFLGQRKLPGFSGSGLRYDQGALGSISYGLNAGGIIRFEGTFGYGRIRLKPALLFPGEDWTRHGGFSLAASLIGPKSTILRFDIGHAFISDYPAVKGNTTVFVSLLKLWK